MENGKRKKEEGKRDRDKVIGRLVGIFGLMKSMYASGNASRRDVTLIALRTEIKMRPVGALPET